MEAHKKPGKVQYEDSQKFDARVYLNSKFSTSKYPWPSWVFDHIDKKENKKILELGCGNGLLWKFNREKIPKTWDILLSDYSPGMIAAAQKTMGDINGKIEYTVVDAEKIDFDGSSFDIVIANNMLYHVRNKDAALAGIKRIIKQDGTFYATTSSRNSFRELKELLYSFMKSSGQKPKADIIVESFCTENGMELLKKYFTDVELVKYEDSLIITEIDAVVNYFTSLEGMNGEEEILKKEYIDEFYKYLEHKISSERGFFVTKDSGMFICTNKDR